MLEKEGDLMPKKKEKEPESIFYISDPCEGFEVFSGVPSSSSKQERKEKEKGDTFDWRLGTIIRCIRLHDPTKGWSRIYPSTEEAG